MCGIVIIYSKTNDLNHALCEDALNSLHHRGPDLKFQKYFLNNKLFIGQTILSITGNPKNNNLSHYHTSRSGRHHVVFNGEIYNFKSLSKYIPNHQQFNTNTDTEVLVNLYDYLHTDEITKYLDGMFGYVVYDEENQKLNIVRDIIGEKIIYWFEDEEKLIIASEIQTILKCIKKPLLNNDLIKKYFFTRHFLTFNETAYQNIYAIPPGAQWKYDLKQKRFTNQGSYGVKSLINLDTIEDNKGRSFDDIVDECDNVFSENARNIMPKIPYASVFSGGVDSSLASHYMLAQENKPQLVALSFPGKDTISEQLDLFEKKLNRPIDIVEVSIEKFKENLVDTYQHTQLPLHTHSFPSQKILAQRVNELGLKVLIGGDGADELFGGYEAYKNFNAGKDNPSPYSCFIDHDTAFTNFDNDGYKQELQKMWEEALFCFNDLEENEARLHAALLLDSTIQLEAVGLRAADLLSMAHSVESRGFFITKSVLQFILNIPSGYKIDNAQSDELFKTKPILKSLFERKFGKSLLFNKQGFSGYPNEAGRLVIDNEYKNLKKTLNPLKQRVNYNNALEWKYLNIEMFLFHNLSV